MGARRSHRAGLALAASLCLGCESILGIEEIKEIPAGASCEGAIDVSLSSTERKAIVQGSTAASGRAHFATDASTCTEAQGPERIYRVTSSHGNFVTARLTPSTTYKGAVLYARAACDDGEAST